MKSIAVKADLEFECFGVRPSGSPQNVAVDSKLFHDRIRLVEVAFHLRLERRDLADVIGFVSVVPGFWKAPGGMIQDETGESEEPHEEEQKQAGIEMQLAIPTFGDGSESRRVWRCFSD